MSRGRKLTKAEKRQRRTQAARVDQLDPLDHGERLREVVTRFASARFAADAIRTMCEDRCDDLFGHFTLAHLAHEVWRDRPGAEPVGLLMADVVEELMRHEARLMELHTRLDALCESHEPPPDLSPTELQGALERVLQPRTETGPLVGGVGP